MTAVKHAFLFKQSTLCNIHSLSSMQTFHLLHSSGYGQVNIRFEKTMQNSIREIWCIFFFIWKGLRHAQCLIKDSVISLYLPHWDSGYLNYCNLLHFNRVLFCAVPSGIPSKRVDLRHCNCNLTLHSLAAHLRYSHSGKWCDLHINHV